MIKFSLFMAKSYLYVLCNCEVIYYMFRLVQHVGSLHLLVMVEKIKWQLISNNFADCCYRRQHI